MQQSITGQGGGPVTDKQSIRKMGQKARRSMTPEEREAASGKIARLIAESDEFRAAHTVLIYRAMPDEADLSYLTELPEAEGKRFCYPRILPKRQMEALLPSGPESWTIGCFGIREPDPSASGLIAPEDLDLVLCPCTAFDENGNRMGMGGGYYDRYLPRCRNAAIAAVAFSSQKTESVPAGRYDIRMETVFTESGAFRS